MSKVAEANHTTITRSGNTTTYETRTSRVNKHGVIRESAKINTIVDNRGKARENKLGKIASIIPSGRSLLMLMFFLPMLIFVITVIFDLTNVTYFYQVQVNGQTQWRYDWLNYFRSLDQAGAALKISFSNLFKIDPQAVPTLANAPEWPNNPDILKVLIYFTKLTAWLNAILVNIIIIGFLNTVLAVFNTISMILSLIIAVFGIRSADGTIFGYFRHWCNWWASIRIPMIPLSWMH